jgi:putative transposase
MLEDKIKRYEETKEMLHATPAMDEEQYPYLKEVDSLALANAQLNLKAACINFFQRPEVGFPDFKRKHRDRDSYTANCANNNISLAGQYIAHPKAGRVRIKKHRGAPDHYKLKSCTAGQESSEKHFTSVLMDIAGLSSR